MKLLFLLLFSSSLYAQRDSIPPAGRSKSFPSFDHCFDYGNFSSVIPDAVWVLNDTLFIGGSHVKYLRIANKLYRIDYDVNIEPVLRPLWMEGHLSFKPYEKHVGDISCDSNWVWRKVDADGVERMIDPYPREGINMHYNDTNGLIERIINLQRGHDKMFQIKGTLLEKWDDAVQKGEVGDSYLSADWVAPFIIEHDSLGGRYYTDSVRVRAHIRKKKKK